MNLRRKKIFSLLCFYLNIHQFFHFNNYFNHEIKIIEKFNNNRKILNLLNN